MKTFNQFMCEAYAAQNQLNEGIPGLGVLGKVGKVLPGLQQLYGIGLGTYRLAKGDKTGAALGYAQALPGPLGWAATGADVYREIKKSSTPQVAKTKPTPAKPLQISGGKLVGYK